MDEGYIKFEASWSRTAPFGGALITELIHWRQQLYDLKLIGAYTHNIGYGNISLRRPGPELSFFISGSATGLIPQATAAHFSLVTAVDIARNKVACEGPVIASSEAMSHAAIYLSDPAIQCVMHIHHARLWREYLNILPTTPLEVAYGSPEMAAALAAIVKDSASRKKGILVTAGHEEGLFAYGETPEQAFAAIRKIFPGS